MNRWKLYSEPNRGKKSGSKRVKINEAIARIEKSFPASWPTCLILSEVFTGTEMQWSRKQICKKYQKFWHGTCDIDCNLWNFEGLTQEKVALCRILLLTTFQEIKI